MLMGHMGNATSFSEESHSTHFINLQNTITLEANEFKNEAKGFVDPYKILFYIKHSPS